MIAFTVHEPSEPARDPLRRADEVVFVKEGFSWLALFVPYLWLIVQRMWIVLAAFVALTLALSGLMLALGASDEAAAWASFLLGLLLAIQANDLRRWTLERRGYRMAAAVSGRSRAECEMKFFADFAARLGQAGRAKEKAGRADKALSPPPPAGEAPEPATP